MTTALVAVVVLLQALDGWSTWQVLRFQRGVEANPLAAFLMAKLGSYVALLLLKGGTAALILLGQFHGVFADTLGLVGLLALALLYVVVVENNLRILYGK